MAEEKSNKAKLGVWVDEESYDFVIEYQKSSRKKLGYRLTQGQIVEKALSLLKKEYEQVSDESEE